MVFFKVENLEFFCSITSDSSLILLMVFFKGRILNSSVQSPWIHHLFYLQWSFSISFFVIFRSFSSSSSEFSSSSFLNFLFSVVFSTAINSKQRLIFLENGFTFLEFVIWNSYPFLNFFPFINGIFLGMFQCFSFENLLFSQ